MSTLLVVNNPARWRLELPGVEVVAAKTYLTDRAFSRLRGTKVYNLCRHYTYQSLGYYVSLLAEARGHRPMPDVNTVMNLRGLSMPRTESQELDEELQRALHPLKSDAFKLSVYFGRNMAARYKRLALRLFNAFPAPFLRAEFVRRGDRWNMTQVRLISYSEIPESHRDFAQQSAAEYLRHPHRRRRGKAERRYELAILHDANEPHQPSSERTVKRFADVAWDLGINCEVIGKADYGRLAEFDALWIRETTAVNHHTYRFARRAASLGLAVIDDPQSILHCTNKVYLAELLARAGLRAPKTVIAHAENVDEVLAEIGLPCVLKRPDGAFSLGVKKASSEAELRAVLEEMLQDSELVIAQEFMPTEYDWRIGMLDGEPLFACRYHMAAKHWQIAKHTGSRTRYGSVDTLPLEEVPPRVLKAAQRAADLIGEGLYGVDIKEVRGLAHVIEVNDNPNVDVGCEDVALGDELWRTLARSFLRRIEALERGPRP
ncbi:MAG: RimK family protein [Planctomycetes bacterium]|nr:RimK family protein [Planctomycetota bacterium]